VIAQSKEWVCGHSLAGNAGSNLSGVVDVLCGCWVLSGRGLCDGPITRPEGSYRVFTGVADKSLARPTSRCILFGGENISFDASFVISINSTNIPPIITINRIYEHQNLLSL
jgi:hypothetical protein